MQVFENGSVVLPSRRQIVIVLAVLCLGAVAQNIWYWEHLPERVATHFGVHGEPNAWMQRTPATLVMLAAQVGIPWLLVGIAAATRRLPTSLINMPHREYWLQLERRESSLDYLQRMVGSVAILSTLFMAVVSHLAYVANQTGAGLAMGWFGLAMAVHLSMVSLLIAALYSRFRLPPGVAKVANLR